MFTTQQSPIFLPHPPPTLPHPTPPSIQPHCSTHAILPRCMSLHRFEAGQSHQAKQLSIHSKEMVGKKRQNYKISKRNKHAYSRKLSKQIANTQQPLDFIVNLSDIPLINTQRAVLNVGLKFIPTPNNPTIQPVVESFLDFQGRMMLRYHFRYVNKLKAIPIFRIFFHQYPHSVSPSSTVYLKYTSPTFQVDQLYQGMTPLTSRLSIFLDYYLKPIVSTLPSFIKYTNHFLQTVLDDQLTISECATLVTLDVRALYTNIPHDEGILGSV